MKLAIDVKNVLHSYKDKSVLNDISLNIITGSKTAFIGPDGVGKSTILSLISGAKILQSGCIKVLGADISNSKERINVQEQIAYMPQGLGRNLYPTLSVQENLSYFSSISGTPDQIKKRRIELLTNATGLAPFMRREAGKLSGGMKQKLALCAALIKEPELLILDEPTTGVDPLSRSQFWDLIDELKSTSPQMTILIATAYMEEAERFENIIAMDDGKAIYQGNTKQFIQQQDVESLEAAYRKSKARDLSKTLAERYIPPKPVKSNSIVIEASNLTMEFGQFKAVDNVSFTIYEGEIFGFIGSNGCGKSTTMKMLTGLLQPTSGDARIHDSSAHLDDTSVRLNIGYMSQSFSLYNELTVKENLLLHYRIYRLSKHRMPERIESVLAEYELKDYSEHHPDTLPLGIRQRLQLATACLHDPKILILDEPTSGVDPEARDMFWSKITHLSREKNVTVFVSTHFMNEVERCDRMSLMHSGKVLLTGTPNELKEKHVTDNLENAFILELKESDGSLVKSDIRSICGYAAEPEGHYRKQRIGASGLQRVSAQFRREFIEIVRDRIRLGFALVGPIILLVALGNGISFDINRVAFSVLDNDGSSDSRKLIESFSESQYFDYAAIAHSEKSLLDQLRGGVVQFGLIIPSDFGKELSRSYQPDLYFLLNGSQTFQAQTSSGYIQSTMLLYMQRIINSTPQGSNYIVPYRLETRYRFNQHYDSPVAIVPGSIMFILALIPAMLSALVVAREKDTGAIYNLYITKLSVPEYIIGKWLACSTLGLASYLLLLMLSIIIFDLTIHGSVVGILVGGGLFILSSTAFGILISCIAQSQMAALLGTAVLSVVPALQFSGFLFPSSALTGVSYWIGHTFSSLWFQKIILSCYAKGASFFDVVPYFGVLCLFSATYIGITCILLRKQES